jgi:hypothetical protein
MYKGHARPYTRFSLLCRLMTFAFAWNRVPKEIALKADLIGCVPAWALRRVLLFVILSLRPWRQWAAHLWRDRERERRRLDLQLFLA